MTIDGKDDLIILGFNKETDCVFLSCDEAEKMRDGLVQIASEISTIYKNNPVTEIWKVRVGLTNCGIVLQFNKKTKQVRLPYHIAIELSKLIDKVVINYKRGYSIKLINKILN